MTMTSLFLFSSSSSSDDDEDELELELELLETSAPPSSFQIQKSSTGEVLSMTMTSLFVLLFFF